MRDAHTKGHTSFCYDDTGRYLISCGNDGDIKIWDSLKDEASAIHQLSICSNSIVFNSGKMYISTKMNVVQSYSFPEATACETVARFTSTVNHITCSSDGNFLACGSGDFSLKLIDLRDNSQNIFLGHQAPILSVAIDPQGDYLASSSCDGSVKVWNIKDKQCLKTLNILPKCNDFCVSKTLARISWHPEDGRCFLIPLNQEVHIYSRDTWIKNRTLSHTHMKETFTMVSFSPSGNFVAASSTIGKIILWNFESGSVVKSIHLDSQSTITDIAWKLTGSEISFANNQGQVGSYCCKSISGTGETKSNINEMFAELSESEEDDDLNLDNVKGNKEAEKSDSDHEEVISQKPKSRVSKMIEEDEDSSGIDLGQIKASYEPQIFGNNQTNREGKESQKVSEVPAQPVIVEKIVQANRQQEAFQPASTPIHFQHRFMMWNSVGLVRCYNTEEENSIDVEFHDVSLHHAIHIQNMMGHTMTALSEEALLLACPAQDEEPSKLVCMVFNSMDSNKEWSQEMPKDENIQAITLGSNWVAAITDRHFVRLFTLGGLQLTVFSIPGPVVCAAGMENVLLLVCHQSAGLKDDQHLVLQKLRLTSKGLSAGTSQTLPLSPKATLTWMGFTDEGSACSVDSVGVMRLNSLRNGSFWSPVACLEDRVKGKSDHYFVVGLSEIKQQIRCILCKGSRYPATLPRPTMSVVPFQMPFCQISTDKTKLEDSVCRQLMLKSLLENLLKEDFQVDQEMESCSKTTIDQMMKLFAMCVCSERKSQALEVGERLPNSRVVQGAIRYASQRNCLILAKKLGETAHRLLRQETSGAGYPDQDIEEEEEEEEEQTITFRPRVSLENGQQGLVIQPKQISSTFKRNSSSSPSLPPLPHLKPNNSHQKDDSSCSLLSEEHIDDSEDTAEIKSEAKKNPFKVSSQQKRVSSGLDAVFQESLEQRTPKSTPQTIKSSKKSHKVSKSSTPQESKSRPEETQKSGEPKEPSAFQLYLEEVKETLAEEYPELDKGDLAKQALKEFKELTNDQKQVWHEKASKNSVKKRKATNNLQLGSQSKKSKQSSKGIAESTSAKISQFMFAKKD